MTPTEVDIDRLVREVLSQFARGESAKPAGGQVSLGDRVVSVELLRDRLQDARAIQVRPGAIITPAARDYLRERDIEVTTRNEQPSTARSSILILAAAAERFDMAALTPLLGSVVAEAETIPTGAFMAVIEQTLAKFTNGDRLGVLFTDRAAAALCIANRNRKVRAVQAAGVECVREAADAVGANLLVIDPRGRSQFEMARMIKEFHAVGPASCPEPLREALTK
jgi:hypothetical protein